MLRPRPGALVVAALVAVAAVIGAGVDQADADKKKKAPSGHKIRLETLPAGASVYVGDQESGPVGQTPLELTLPAGEQVVILELEGHLTRFETIIVEPLTGKQASIVQSFTYELDPASATLVIEAEEGVILPAGTTVRIDGVDQGTPPLRLEVEVGPHQVEVVADGRTPYEEWVEVEGGQEHLMAIGAAQLGAEVDAGGDAGATPPKKPAAGPVGTALTGVEIGGRRFRYDTPRTANLRPYTASGSVLFAVDLELHPWRRFVTSRLLDRLSVTAGAGYAPPIAASDDDGTTIYGYWRSQHAGVRLRGLDRAKVAVDVDVGWMHTLYTFRDEEMRLVTEVPDVDYQMIRIGARVVGHATSTIDAWIGADNRLVLSAGALEDRFDAADVDGVSARAGGAARFLGGHLEARLEAGFTRFGWSFESEAGDTYDAEGGSDWIYGVTVMVGGSY